MIKLGGEKLVLLVFLLLLQLAVQGSAANDPEPDSPLLESGKAATIRKHDPGASEIKIVSYNIRWRAGDELKRIVKVLHEDREVGGALILGLQEVDRRKKRTGHNNTAKMLAEELGLHYVWTAPPAAKEDAEEETGVALLSVYPLTDVVRIVLPHPGPKKRRRVAVGAMATCSNSRKTRSTSLFPPEFDHSDDKRVDQAVS